MNGVMGVKKACFDWSEVSMKLESYCAPIIFFQLRNLRKLCRLGSREGGSPKDDLLNRPYLIKKTTRGEGVKNHQFGDDIFY